LALVEYRGIRFLKSRNCHVIVNLLTALEGAANFVRGQNKRLGLLRADQKVNYVGKVSYHDILH